MALSSTERIDIVNIGLMILSAIAAFMLPFQLFLFVYAVLGPLHYLTEISWLHDKQYFTKGKYDAVWLLVVGVVLMLNFFRFKIELEFPPMFDANLMFIALLSALIFVTVKNTFYKIGGIVVLVFASQLSHNMNFFLTVFVPTLIHVYVFTALFMLYGTIKSKSRVGMWAFALMVAIPFILYNVMPGKAFYMPSAQTQFTYRPFEIVNRVWFSIIDKVPVPGTVEGWNELIFSSTKGIMLMRFIAFAYTYHYLNWFSKTKVIQWHKVPKLRFAIVIVVWIASVAIYMYNYETGLQWLLLLSFMHVLLEFPLNVISIMGIGEHIKSKVFKPAQA
ncbi:MAG: hypothetical protein H6551_02955 [Chitinophagales bacterium]|nr:hypothetical protein [Chitinophagaceae bacterium]MCB9064083.1 hypothetical protein [Chitinophagales bacterium]